MVVLNFFSYFENVCRVHAKRVQVQFVYHCCLFLIIDQTSMAQEKKSCIYDGRHVSRRRRREVGCMRPRFMPLAMLTMRKELHGFLFLCMHAILFLELWWSGRQPFGRRSPAENAIKIAI